MIMVVTAQPVDSESIRVEFSDDSVEVLPVSEVRRMFEVDTSGLTAEKREAVSRWVDRFGPPRA